MTMPTMTYRVAFASDPLAASPTWTTVTNWAFTSKITRGRQHELAVVEPGRIDIALDNRDRRFDPSNTSSPYSPNVLPMKEIQVQATWSGTTYGLFTGYVEAWPVTWADAASSTVAVKAIDGLKILGLKKVRDTTTYAAAVNADSPQSVFHLSEAPGSTAFADSVGAGAAASIGAVTAGVRGALPDNPDSAVDLGAYAGYLTCGNGPSTVYDIEFWCYPRSYTTAAGATAVLAYSVNLQLPITGAVKTALTLNRWHHVVLRLDSTHVFIDGVDMGVGALVLGGGSSYGIVIGGDSVSPTAGTFDGIIDEIALYTEGTIDVTKAAAHHTAAKFATTATAGTRIGQVLDVIGWPAGARSVDTGTYTMQPGPPQLFDTFALPYIQTLTKSEGNGALAFIDGSGTVVFRDRSHATPASSATFGDGVGELPYRLDSLEVVLDDIDIHNDLIGQADNGVVQTATNATSQTTYGPRSLSITGLANNSDSDVAAIVTDVANRYGTPHIRVASVQIHPLDNPTGLWPQVLARDIGDRITVKRSSFPTGSSFQQDYFIEGVDHEIGADDWVTTWRLAPVELTGWFTLDDDQLGVLDVIPLMS